MCVKEANLTMSPFCMFPYPMVSAMAAGAFPRPVVMARSCASHSIDIHRSRHTTSSHRPEPGRSFDRPA
jgi:hypothetical protein